MAIIAKITPKPARTKKTMAKEENDQPIEF
jgi:hypothetical protein